jgi:hypothetical protein
MLTGYYSNPNLIIVLSTPILFQNHVEKENELFNKSHKQLNKNRKYPTKLLANFIDRYDATTLPGKSKKKKNNITRIRHIMEVTIPYFCQKLELPPLQQILIKYLSHTRTGQKITSEVLQEVKKSTKDTTERRTISKELSVIMNSQKLDDKDATPILCHIFGLDEAIISPSQWTSYKQLQSKNNNSLGSEKGRRCIAYLHRYIEKYLHIHVIKEPGYVAYRDPLQVLSLHFQIIHSILGIHIPDYRAIIRVTVDGRKISPYNCHYSWTIVGLQNKSNKTLPITLDADIRNLFPTQHWKSVCTLVLYEGNESTEDVNKYCSEVTYFLWK